AALFGQGLAMLTGDRKFSRHRKLLFLFLWMGAIGIYGAIALQLYISAAVLLPVFFPAATLGVYVVPLLRKD
ncbi:MAG: hypothetical protein SVX43_18145, partial [Cyanobacteriota bacterium]|nr:hypothetical protein [Cyanobacteriota bacterium]